MDIDKKIEEKKKKLLKTMVGEKRAEKTKKIKFGTVIPEVIDKMIKANKWKEYDKTTKNFLIAKFGREIAEGL